MNASWIAKWRGSRVFVLGDIMLDRFVYGHVERISPEAPIPSCIISPKRRMLGGAANVARNIVTLGGEAVLVGALGDDADGDLVAGPLVASDRIEGRFVRAARPPDHDEGALCIGWHSRSCASMSSSGSILRAQDIETICGWLLEAIGQRVGHCAFRLRQRRSRSRVDRACGRHRSRPGHSLSSSTRSHAISRVMPGRPCSPQTQPRPR